ncbi:MAG: CdaR family protein [Leptospiraceae bacterium]|nr:CdaR family protein [Leptospiraceae bacterium]MDW8306805.1 CdaR family protein [Leptospiraceae bacterium]
MADFLRIFRVRTIPKLFSILAALLLYLYVQQLQVREVKLNVALSYQNKPPGLALVGEVPRFVVVTLAGREEALKFSAVHLRAEVNLAMAESGRALYPVEFDKRQLPENVKVRQIPSFVELTLERIVRKRVNVRVRTVGKVADGFRIQKIHYQPENVLVEAPESLINGIKEIHTSPISLDGLKDNIERRLRLVFPTGVQSEVSEVEVRVSVIPLELSGERQFENIPIRAINLDPALYADFSDKTVKVTIVSEKEILKKLSPADINASVDLSETRYNPRTGSVLPYEIEQGLPVKVRLMRYTKEASITSFSPENVSVRFRVKEEYRKREVTEEKP